jgi:hypothetical protein
MPGRESNISADIEAGPVIADCSGLSLDVNCGWKIAGKTVARKQRHGGRTGRA